MTAKKDAGVWFSFAAGMYAEACLDASQHTDALRLTPNAALTEFLDSTSAARIALEITPFEALASYEAGRKMMQEIRDAGAAKWNPLQVAEDNQPLSYTGPERQLTGKPDGRLS